MMERGTRTWLVIRVVKLLTLTMQTTRFKRSGQCSWYSTPPIGCGTGRPLVRAQTDPCQRSRIVQKSLRRQNETFSVLPVLLLLAIHALHASTHARQSHGPTRTAHRGSDGAV